MRKIIFILVLGFSVVHFAKGQVICIFCYDQNEPISEPVNNLLSNGGFESGCFTNGYFCPASPYYTCAFSNWICTGGDTLTYARAEDSYFSVIPEGLTAAYFGNFFSNSCSVSQFDTLCLSTINCEVTGIPSGYPNNFNTGYGGNTGVSLEQYVSGLTPGNTYVLEFWTGGEYDSGNFSESGLFAVDLGFGKIFLRDKVTIPSTGIGTRYIIVFNATASYHSIKFTNWGHACYECTELILDDVKLYTLAELSSSVPSCFTGTNIFYGNISHKDSQISPNPFTTSATISFGSEVREATFTLYNLLGGKICQTSGINAEIFQFNRGTLGSGVYIYEVTEKEKKICTGKAVVY